MFWLRLFAKILQGNSSVNLAFWGFKMAKSWHTHEVPSKLPL